MKFKAKNRFEFKRLRILSVTRSLSCFSLLESLSKSDNELKLITEEILGLSQGVVTEADKNTVLETMRAKADKVKNIAKEYGSKKSLEEVTKAVEAELDPQLTQIDDNIIFFKELKNKISNGGKVKEIQELITQRANGNKEFAQKGLDFVQNVAESLKSRAKGSTRCIKQIGGVGIGLIILPITCTLLNKIYPVFMDKFFPELSLNKKKAQTVKMDTTTGTNLSTESEVKNAA